jgi:hypothetical protein
MVKFFFTKRSLQFSKITNRSLGKSPFSSSFGAALFLLCSPPLCRPSSPPPAAKIHASSCVAPPSSSPPPPWPYPLPALCTSSASLPLLHQASGGWRAGRSCPGGSRQLGLQAAPERGGRSRGAGEPEAAAQGAGRGDLARRPAALAGVTGVGAGAAGAAAVRRGGGAAARRGEWSCGHGTAAERTAGAACSTGLRPPPSRTSFRSSSSPSDP